MDDEAEHPELQAILANLSLEVSRPLDSLHAGVLRFLDDVDPPLSEAEMNQARMMLELCDDLRRLTVERLGGATPAGG